MIKNIILDFGDIFINLDKPATAREMTKFGFKEITPELDTLFKDYEKGLLSSEAFLDTTHSAFPKASKQDLIQAWNTILLDFPEYRLDFLEEFAQQNRYKLLLLSNTNAIHIDHVKTIMGMDRFNRFKNAFDQFYLSYEMKMRKPDAEIFEYVLQENGLVAAETLFVDDTKENTDTASSVGIQVWNLQVGKEDIIDLKQHL